MGARRFMCIVVHMGGGGRVCMLVCATPLHVCEAGKKGGRKSVHVRCNCV